MSVGAAIVFGGGGSGGTGDASGPASSTDNAVARFDGTGGKTLQNSAVTVDDSGNMSGVGTLATSGAITQGGTAVSLSGHTHASYATGPASSTDNAVARFDGTGGKTLQGSSVVIDDSDNMSGVAKYVVTKTPGTDHTGAGLVATFTAGETLAQNELVYVKSDGKAWKAQANASTTIPAIGMAMAAANADAAVDILLFGTFADASWSWTIGGLLYVSAATAGLITQSAPAATGNQVQIVGIALSATVVFIRPDLTYVEVA